MVNVIIYILLTVHVLLSVLLTLLVLMQRPKSEGLGAAFGGGMTESLFGAGTSEVLTKMTIWLGSIFIIITLSLAILYTHRTSSKIHQQLLTPAAETAPATTAPDETSAPSTPATSATPEQPKK